ncbi:hypothetical protein DD237_006614 [Peronospora effusa]|uniref:RWP-RK domain-containing protein n=1 Tax=Peronospora effusa TaxID=542832 RepID=A0A425C5M9_9STRA|nr:hypothetical protein DD237_006614 [Peronospora effusa]
MTPRSVNKRYGPVVHLEDLRKCFNMPIAAVAQKFGICVTLLKKICRHHGIQRWPHRQIRSLEKSIDMLRESLDSAKGTNKEYVAKKIMAFEYTLECIIQDPNAAAKGILAGRLASPATEETNKRGNRAKSLRLKTRAAMSDDEDKVLDDAETTRLDAKEWVQASQYASSEFTHVTSVDSMLICLMCSRNALQDALLEGGIAVEDSVNEINSLTR